MPQRILITGISGFISQFLSHFLNSKGYEIYGTARAPIDISGVHKIFQASLGDSIESFIKEHEIDAIIHCANASGINTYEANVLGTQKWANEAYANNITKQVFISSITAKAEAKSRYGKEKYELEQWFNERNAVVLKPGLVIGRGGLFARMESIVTRFPIVPILGGGKSQVFFTGITPLSELIEQSLKGNLKNGIWYVQQPQSVTLKQLLVGIQKHLKLKRIFISIPITPIYYLLKLFELILPFKLGFSSTNLKGLTQNSEIKLKSDYENLGCKNHELSELLKLEEI